MLLRLSGRIFRARSGQPGRKASRKYRRSAGKTAIFFNERQNSRIFPQRCGDTAAGKLAPPVPNQRGPSCHRLRHEALRADGARAEISMPKRMLIDASHPEETRVVVLDGQKVEEFDFEAASKRPLKGNIYLAKVTRVEPSLQAAFVEYGGNRKASSPSRKSNPTITRSPSPTAWRCSPSRKPRRAGAPTRISNPSTSRPAPSRKARSRATTWTRIRLRISPTRPRRNRRPR